MATTFECDNVVYDLHFNLRSCETFENLRGKSVIEAVAQSTNLMMISDIKAFLSVGLHYADGGRIPSAQASKIADEIIESEGVAALTIAIVEALERDCAFLTATPTNADTIG